jgi:hypothetical protein
MRYFENGYEQVGTGELCGASRVMTRFLPIECRLYMIGSAACKRRAALYLKRGLERCACANDEFMLHFLCEQNCGVRIVRADNRLLSA